MGRVPQPPSCDGTVVVHEDATYTCTDDRCGASESTFAALNRHSWFLACRDALGEGCPICQQFRFRQAPFTT
jgi:hypothetical protein